MPCFPLPDEPVPTLPILLETFVEHIDRHLSLPSTNTRALELAAEPELVLPTLVFAEEQTAGRGRGGNSWLSSTGALTFSLIVARPSRLSPERLPLVSLAVGLACRESLATLLPEAEFRLKWPNDLYLNGRKLAGILTETTSRSPDRLIIGIGLNVNNSLDEAPDGLQSAGISLADYRGQPVDRADLMVRLLLTLEDELARLNDAGTIDPRRWFPHCLLTGRIVTLQLGRRQLAGTCRGITPEGGLRLERDGRIETITSGTVLAW